MHCGVEQKTGVMKAQGGVAHRRVTVSQGHMGSSGWRDGGPVERELSEGEMDELGFGRQKSDHSSPLTECSNRDSAPSVPPLPPALMLILPLE